MKAKPAEQEKTKRELLKTFDVVSPFWEGLSAACYRGEWLHIRPNGKPAYQRRFAHVYSFTGGLAPARNKKGLWCHIGHDGKPAYKQRYLYVGPFSQGLAVVCNKLGIEFKIRPDGTRAD